MLNMNKVMTKIISAWITQTYDDRINGMVNEIVQKTRKIQDAVIYNEDETDELTIDFEKIFKFADDWTGYEIGCNEIRMEKSVLPFD